MFNKIFKNQILNNNRGSSLTITLVVIAVMAFSLTSITKMTINLSGSTTAELNSVADESLAKGLITQAISEFEDYIVATDSYTDFNNAEIPRILSELNVIVNDVTAQFPEFGDNAGRTTTVYKFAFDLDNGDTLYKYAYMSNMGSSVDTYLPFEFSIGTEGDLILNGGYYDEIKMFGERIFVSNAAPWEENELVWEYVTATHHMTPSNSAYPTFTDGNNISELFFGTSYEYCTSGCFDVTESGSNPYVINTSEYQNAVDSGLSDEGEVQGEHIISFFNDFSFENYLVEHATQILPTDNRQIYDSMDLGNFESVIRNNMDVITYKSNGRTVKSYPSTAYVDITDDSNYNFASSDETLRFAAVYDTYNDDDPSTNELVINKKVTVADFDDEGFIVLGDLILENSASNKTPKFKGTYIVTGDLIMRGYSNEFDKATFIVLGETIMDYDYGYGLKTKNDRGFTLVAQDNVFFDEMWENYGTSTPSEITIFIYTEESIFIDAVESKYKIEGSLFARALGVSGNDLFMEDELGNPIRGIVINSYRGYVDLDWYYNWSTGLWEKDLTPVPSTRDSANRFYISDMKVKDYAKRFINVPAFEGVTISDGDYTLETSEWKVE